MAMLCTVCKISKSQVNLGLPEDSCQNSLRCYTMCRNNSSVQPSLLASDRYPGRHTLLELLNRADKSPKLLQSFDLVGFTFAQLTNDGPFRDSSHRSLVALIYFHWCSIPVVFGPFFKRENAKIIFHSLGVVTWKMGRGSCAVLFLILLKLSP